VFLLTSSEQVEGLAEQHDGDATQADEHEYALHGALPVEHELLAAGLRLSAREQHHVDEQDKHGRGAALTIR
jgi:hypothetical protein